MSRLVNAADRVAAASNGDRQPVNSIVQRTSRPVRKAGQRADLNEIGTYGLRQYGGYVTEEWLRQLSGAKRAWAFREMMDNDPVVGAILYAIRMLARGVPYEVKEGNDPQAAEFVESCMHDMSHTWGDLVSEVLSCLGYGWSYHELVYKRRNGPQPNTKGAAASSAFTDGKIGWRKMPVRAQETLLKWQFDAVDDGLVAMEQLDYHGRHNIIPIEKAVLFRTTTARNNPEGRSILRAAYVPWFRLKNIQEIEAIGIERDLAGIPVATPPEGVDLNQPANAGLLAVYQELVTTIRRDEDEGVVMPQAGAKLELLTTGGSRQIDTDAIVRRYEQRIASSMLADFILIGQDSVGSFAMVDVKADLFGVALDAILDIVCEVINRYAIPRLLALNGMDVSEPPQVTHGSTGRINLERVGVFLNQMALAGAQIPWSRELVEALFNEAGLPANFDAMDAEAAEDGHPPDAAPGPAARPADDSGQPSDPAALAKAERARKAQSLVPNAAGAIPVSPILRQRAKLLQNAYEQDVAHALRGLGDQAQRAYLATVQKATTTDAPGVAQRVIDRLGLSGWFQRVFQPIIQAHSQRVLNDTLQTLRASAGLAVSIPDPEARRIVAAGGTNLGLTDIEASVKQALIQALTEGREQGLGANEIARRIRQYVPAGRFTAAGPQYRSRLIARTETLNAMRQSSLAAYRAAPTVTAVQISDGILPDSDAECEERDGDVVSFDTAQEMMASTHPLCTLSWDPVIVQPGDVLPE